MRACRCPLMFVRVVLLLRHCRRQSHAIVVDRPPIFYQCPNLQPSGGKVMATIVAPPADHKASERKFYSRMAIFLVVVVLLGFAPSFYLKGIVPPYPRPN